MNLTDSLVYIKQKVLPYTTYKVSWTESFTRADYYGLVVGVSLVNTTKFTLQHELKHFYTSFANCCCDFTVADHLKTNASLHVAQYC